MREGDRAPSLGGERVRRKVSITRFLVGLSACFMTELVDVHRWDMLTRSPEYAPTNTSSLSVSSTWTSRHNRLSFNNCCAPACCISFEGGIHCCWRRLFCLACFPGTFLPTCSFFPHKSFLVPQNLVDSVIGVGDIRDILGACDRVVCALVRHCQLSCQQRAVGEPPWQSPTNISTTCLNGKSRRREYRLRRISKGCCVELDAVRVQCVRRNETPTGAEGSDSVGRKRMYRGEIDHGWKAQFVSLCSQNAWRDHS